MCVLSVCVHTYTFVSKLGSRDRETSNNHISGHVNNCLCHHPPSPQSHTVTPFNHHHHNPCHLFVAPFIVNEHAVGRAGMVEKRPLREHPSPNAALQLGIEDAEVVAAKATQEGLHLFVCCDLQVSVCVFWSEQVCVCVYVCVILEKKKTRTETPSTRKIRQSTQNDASTWERAVCVCVYTS